MFHKSNAFFLLFSGQCVFPWKREVCDRHQVISCHPFPHLAESIFEVLPDAQDEDERNEDGTDEKIRPEQRNSNAANGLRERPRSGGSKEQQSSNGNNYPTRTTPNRPRPYLERDYYRGYKYPRYENALAAQVAHQKNRPSGSKGGSGDVAIRPHETENVAPRFPPRQNNFLGMHPVFILPDGKRVRLPSSQSLAQIREDIATEIQEAPNADLFIADVIGSVRSVVESIVIFIGEGIDGLTEMVREAGSNLMQGTSGEIWRETHLNANI